MYFRTDDDVKHRKYFVNKSYFVSFTEFAINRGKSEFYLNNLKVIQCDS